MRSGKIIELSDLTNIANCSEIQNTNVSENLRCGDIKCCKYQLTYFGLIDGTVKLGNKELFGDPKVVP